MTTYATAATGGGDRTTSQEPVVVAPEDTLGETAEKMEAYSAGSALVLDFGQPIGVVTSHDLVRASAARVHPSEARVRDWMSEGEGLAEVHESALDGAAVSDYAPARQPPRTAAGRSGEPGLCELQYAAGRIEGCPGESCLYWVDDACVLGPVRVDIVSDPQLASFLLDLRSRVGPASAPSIFGLLPGLAS